MSAQNQNLLIGTLLRNAGLIDHEQLQNALSTQKQYIHIKLGEILVLHEQITSQTIDFFANEWASIKKRGWQFPIGYYLQRAFLLNEQQITTILTEQKSNNLKFGDIAVRKGWVKPKTITFLIDNLSANYPQLIPLTLLEEYNQAQLHLERKYTNPSIILSRILAWTGGDTRLTKNICQIFADSDFNISAERETSAVDQLIERDLIKNWSTSKLGSSVRFINQDLDNDKKCDSLKLWQEYREILLSENIEYQKNQEQLKLLSLGLIVREDSKLRVTSLIYRQIFDQDWVAKKIARLNQKNNQKAANVVNKNIDYQQKGLNSRETNMKTKTKPKNSKPQTRTKALWLIMFIGAISFIPLLFIINNYLSSTQKDELLVYDSEAGAVKLTKFCNDVNLLDLETGLNTIFELKQKKKEILRSNSNNLSAFPEICEATLNELVILTVPKLGKEDKTLEAIRLLCDIPQNSEFLTEAKVWLDRWYHSPTWSKETKFYLKEVPSCPAGKLLLEIEHTDHL